MFYPMFDMNYWVLVGPAILFTLWAQSQVRGAYSRWSKVRAGSGLTGAEVAQDLIRRAGAGGVAVQRIDGQLTDHYDPRAKVVRLSGPVYDGRSLAALGIAAHEIGHVLQDHEGYAWLGLRNAIVPITQLGSRLAMPLLLMGIVLAQPSLMDLGILLFLTAIVFQLVTLPVEFNASARALRLLESGGYIIGQQETSAVRQVLNAAALTYVAALVVAVMQFIYLLGMRQRS